MEWQYWVLFGLLFFVLASYLFISWCESGEWLPKGRSSDNALLLFFAAWAICFCIQIAADHFKQSPGAARIKAMAMEVSQ